MKSILKKVKGGLILSMIFGLHIIAPAGLFAGVGTLIAQQSTEKKLDSYYNDAVVQEVVSDAIFDEGVEITEQLKADEIGTIEYEFKNNEINSDSHKEELTKKVANEVFADNEEYLTLSKRNEQLTTAYQTTFSIMGGSAFCLFAGYIGPFDSMLNSAEKSLDEAMGIDFENMRKKRQKWEEKQNKKAEKEYQEELDAYDEEVLT